MFSNYFGSMSSKEMILDIIEDTTVNIASRRFKGSQGEYHALNDFFLGGRSLKLGTLLMDFLTYDFESYDGFVDFIDKYGIGGLGSLSASIQNIETSTIFNDESKKNVLAAAWGESKNILSKAQQYFRLAIYYSLDLDSEKCLNALNSKQRFYLLSFPDIYEAFNEIIPDNEMANYTGELKTRFSIDSADIDRIQIKDVPRDVEEAAALFMDFEFVAKKSYYSTNIISILYVEFIELVKNGAPVKRCGHCGHYFIPENKIDTEFCNRTVKYVNGIPRTCKEVGPKERYRKNKSKEPLNLLFDKKYKTLYARIDSNGKKGIKWFQFEYWRDEAKRRLEVAKIGTDKEKDEFKEWLEKSCKIEWLDKIYLEANNNGINSKTE